MGKGGRQDKNFCTFKKTFSSLPVGGFEKKRVPRPSHQLNELPLYQILYLFIFVARCPNNPNTIFFFQSDTHLLMLFFSPWKICVFMTRQVDLLYMKHNTSFQSQVMLAATQNSNFPRGAGAIYRMIYEIFSWLS